jgi:hypothetical protein
MCLAYSRSLLDGLGLTPILGVPFRLLLSSFPAVGDYGVEWPARQQGWSGLRCRAVACSASSWPTIPVLSRTVLVYKYKCIWESHVGTTKNIASPGSEPATDTGSPYSDPGAKLVRPVDGPFNVPSEPCRLTFIQPPPDFGALRHLDRLALLFVRIVDYVAS